MSDITVHIQLGISPDPTPGDKATKAEAHYHIQEPDRPDFDETVRCGTCVHFNMTRCQIVAGFIDPNYVCDYWDAHGVDSSAPQLDKVET
jgi:hypothetical protein